MSQSFHTASDPVDFIIAATSAADRLSSILNCSVDLISSPYPPGLVLEPALIRVTQSFTRLSRREALSRVESTIPASAKQSRSASIILTMSLSVTRCLYSAVACGAGLSLGKEKDTCDRQYFFMR